MKLSCFRFTVKEKKARKRVSDDRVSKQLRAVSQKLLRGLEKIRRRDYISREVKVNLDLENAHEQANPVDDGANHSSDELVPTQMYIDTETKTASDLESSTDHSSDEVVFNDIENAPANKATETETALLPLSASSSSTHHSSDEVVPTQMHLDIENALANKAPETETALLPLAASSSSTHHSSDEVVLTQMSKYDPLHKENEELIKVNQALYKQLEDLKLKQEKDERSMADVTGEQVKKEEEKDLRMLALEKTVERLRNELINMKDDRQKEEERRRKQEEKDLRMQALENTLQRLRNELNKMKDDHQKEAEKCQKEEEEKNLRIQTDLEATETKNNEEKTRECELRIFNTALPQARNGNPVSDEEEEESESLIGRPKEKNEEREQRTEKENNEEREQRGGRARDNGGTGYEGREGGGCRVGRRGWDYHDTRYGGEHRGRGGCTEGSRGGSAHLPTSTGYGGREGVGGISGRRGWDYHDTRYGGELRGSSGGRQWGGRAWEYRGKVTTCAWFCESVETKSASLFLSKSMENSIELKSCNPKQGFMTQHTAQNTDMGNGRREDNGRASRGYGSGGGRGYGSGNPKQGFLNQHTVPNTGNPKQGFMNQHAAQNADIGNGKREDTGRASRGYGSGGGRGYGSGNPKQGFLNQHTVPNTDMGYGKREDNGRASRGYGSGGCGRSRYYCGF